MNQEEETVRRRVAETYGRIITGDAGCCDPALQDCASPPTGQSIESVAGADIPSFGCGSPVTLSDIQPGDVLLDLGCGAGLDLLLAAEKVGPTGRVLGVDMTDEMIGAARANAAAAGFDNIEVRRGVVEDLPVADESVDWVISNCVINLSPQKPRVFAEIARVLRPGGRMRVADIVVEDIPDWVRHNARLFDSCIAGAISEAAYVAGLRDAGLAELRVDSHYVYDRNQLAAIVAGTADATVDTFQAADELVGRVWSVYISATRLPLEEQPDQAKDGATTSCCPHPTESDCSDPSEEVSP